MDRFDVVRFDDLTGPKGGDWVRIGGGSFGVVFRGEYLGTEVAIKEVLANNTYDVEKYFERECVLMKEARHPNIVQYIGLTRSPGHDGRIYIISEYVGGNLRSFIADKRKPFDWRLRVSFATDIARAVAYLHARNCMHRDLKGENLLITDNQRIKVCDFGFARIAARNEDEMRRISYCGTDGYMSPEILMGIDFSLPSDVFSLGIIFCEIISRHLVDSHTFKRQMPTFGLDEDEVRSMATKGCPADFSQLCIDMCEVEPERRPTMRHVIRRLRAIEQEIVNREAASGTLSNIGSVRGTSLAAIAGSKAGKHGGKSTHAKGSPRLPSFDGQVRVGRTNSVNRVSHLRDISDETCSSSEDEDVEEALAALEKLSIDKDSIRAAKNFKVSGHGNPWSWDPKDTLDTVSEIKKAGDDDHTDPPETATIIMKKNTDAKKNGGQQEGEYSTSVVRTSKADTRTPLTASLSRMTGSKMTQDEQPTEQAQGQASQVGSTATVLRRKPLETVTPNDAESQPVTTSKQTVEQAADDAMDLDDAPRSYLTAKDVHLDTSADADATIGHSSEPSIAVATIASMSIHEQPGGLLYHRFTLVKNGTRRPQIEVGKNGARVPSPRAPSPMPASRVPYQLMLANALTKCSVCARRLGFQAYMDCDDCPYKTHVACADAAEPNCQEMHIPGGEDEAHGLHRAALGPSQGVNPAGKFAATASKAAKHPIDSTPAGGVSFLRKRYSNPPPKRTP